MYRNSHPPPTSATDAIHMEGTCRLTHLPRAALPHCYGLNQGTRALLFYYYGYRVKICDLDIVPTGDTSSAVGRPVYIGSVEEKRYYIRRYSAALYSWFFYILQFLQKSRITRISRNNSSILYYTRTQSKASCKNDCYSPFTLHISPFTSRSLQKPRNFRRVPERAKKRDSQPPHACSTPYIYILYLTHTLSQSRRGYKYQVYSLSTRLCVCARLWDIGT